jgi:hypothetical protein
MQPPNVGCPDRRIDRLCITLFALSNRSHRARCLVRSFMPFRAIAVIPVVVGIAFVLSLVLSIAISAINTNPYALIGSPWLPIIAIGASIVQAVLLAPLAIAVHRFVLLGEKTNRYPLEPKSSRYLRFVGFAILIKFSG